MAFTTIETVPGLRDAERRRLRGLRSSKLFAPATYHSMIRRAGLSIVIERDVTRTFEATLVALIASNRRHAAGVIRESGREAFEGDLAWYADRLIAVREGLIRRVLYVCERA